MNEWPADVVAAIEGGEVVVAIKLLRQHTGLGLAQAKEAVDRYRAGDHSPLNSPAAAQGSADSGLPPAALDALARGNKLEAVKLVREASGLGLAEAKDLVDAHLHGTPSFHHPIHSVADAQDAVRAAMAEPGRVAASPLASPLPWLVVAVVAAGAWVYLNYFL